MNTQEQTQIPFPLVGGGDCTLHFHSADRAPTHDTLDRLQDLCNHVDVTTAYAVRYADDIVMVTDGATVTLPLANRGKEFEVVQMDNNPVLVNFTSPDTLYGETSMLIEQQGTAIRLKAISGGWIII